MRAAPEVRRSQELPYSEHLISFQGWPQAGLATQLN
jgi:hypothetical protein